MALTARAAASFCVFLTLDTAGFFAVETALRPAGLAEPFLALADCFGFAAFRPVTLGVLRAAVDFAALALLALGLEGFALTARFAVFDDARFALEGVVDRRKPFVRLLLMGGISKGCSTFVSSRRIARELNTASPLNQWAQVFAGALSIRNPTIRSLKVPTEKNT